MNTPNTSRQQALHALGEATSASLGQSGRRTAAIRGIGYAILALVDQLERGDDAADPLPTNPARHIAMRPVSDFPMDAPFLCLRCGYTSTDTSRHL